MEFRKKDKDVYTALGLMSGTSLDGVDAAIIKTDGEIISGFGPAFTLEYDETFRERLRAVIRGEAPRESVETRLTELHGEAVQHLLEQHGIEAGDIDVIGFHGQTITHKPDEGITVQIGDGKLLAKITGIDVVCDFRSSDVAEGGQGAPLVPLYHAALTDMLPKPLGILNIGGVANITWLGKEGEIIAMDTGPGNALINDWVHKATGADCDRDGVLANRGRVNEGLIAEWLMDPYFSKPAPKSLDRNHFDVSDAAGLSLEDAVATITEFTVSSIELSVHLLPSAPSHWYVCGGGRNNPAIMQSLWRKLQNVQDGETLGWNGDALEAQAFGFLAVRSLKKLPLSLPTTTGVKRPMTGGTLFKA